ncbi:MAG TPA: DUF1343 domain-containing protein [Thermoanaerobaculia bacterium]|nr:DUF1343 domain-containing protein [Thermoanaerobaculia bacterium]
MARIHLGIDVLLSDPSSIRGQRIALLTNYAAMTRDGIRTVDALRDVCEIVRILAPEHGFWGDVAYLEDVDADEYLGIRVESLYGTKSEASLAPRPEQLNDVDALIVDLPDVGARYYTYAASMGNCMAVAAQTGTPVIVLDRPNPLTGLEVEGNINFGAPYRSFVGQYPLPIRHGLTIGELAIYVNDTQPPRCNLEVIAMRGWKRDMWWEDTELPWTHTSPNMPTVDTAVVYPGMCLLEGTNLSEGRGTTRPFELAGAPWLDEQRVASALNDLGLDGVRFEPFVFRPTFNKHHAVRCRGVFVRVTDRNAFRPVRAAMLMIKVIRDLNPAEFQWFSGFYEFASVLAIDALTGSAEYRDLVENGSIHDLAEWIEAAEERRLIIETERQSAQLAEYDDSPRATVTSISRGVTDMATVMDVPRAEA